MHTGYSILFCLLFNVCCYALYCPTGLAVPVKPSSIFKINVLISMSFLSTIDLLLYACF